MKKPIIVVLCLLFACSVFLGIAGCGEKEPIEEENGTSTKVEVPDVTGLSSSEAEKTLQAEGLDVSVSEENVSDESKNGVVLRQDPEPGTMLTPDMTVYIDVGKLQ